VKERTFGLPKDDRVKKADKRQKSLAGEIIPGQALSL
jgi:hypothetical protein